MKNIYTIVMACLLLIGACPAYGRSLVSIEGVIEAHAAPGSSIEEVYLREDDSASMIQLRIPAGLPYVRNGEHVRVIGLLSRHANMMTVRNIERLHAEKIIYQDAYPPEYPVAHPVVYPVVYPVVGVGIWGGWGRGGYHHRY